MNDMESKLRHRLLDYADISFENLVKRIIDAQACQHGRIHAQGQGRPRLPFFFQSTDKFSCYMLAICGAASVST